MNLGSRADFISKLYSKMDEIKLNPYLTIYDGVNNDINLYTNILYRQDKIEVKLILVDKKIHQYVFTNHEPSLDHEFLSVDDFLFYLTIYK